MVNFNVSHKHQLVAAGRSSGTIVDFYDDKGEWGEIDVSLLSTDDLWALRRTMKNYFDEQIRVIDQELDNWTTIHCYVCGRDDIAYRGQPFVTWGIRGGYILCPQHLMAFDRIGTPRHEIYKKMQQEEREIKEIFGE